VLKLQINYKKRTKAEKRLSLFRTVHLYK